MDFNLTWQTSLGLGKLQILPSSICQTIGDALRASLAVWQIELPSLIFGKNVKNTHPTVWQKTWQFLAT